MTNETLTSFYAVFNANGSYFGCYRGDTKEEAFKTMSATVGDAGDAGDWQIVERFIIDGDYNNITVWENGVSVDDEEIEDILEQCGFAGYRFDMARCDESADGEGFVFAFSAPED